MNLIKLLRINVVAAVILLLVMSMFINKQPWDSKYFKTSFDRSNDILGVIPKSVVYIKIIAQRHEFSECSVSTMLQNEDSSVFQRTVEYLYPIRIVQNSNFIFSLAKESVSDNCHQLDKENEVVLNECR